MFKKIAISLIVLMESCVYESLCKESLMRNELLFNGWANFMRIHWTEFN